MLCDFYRNDTIKRVETKTCFKYPEREYLSVSDAMIRLSEWRLKLVLSIPSVSIFAISIAKIRHPFGGM